MNQAEVMDHNARVRTGTPGKLTHIHIEHHMENGEVKSHSFEPSEGQQAMAHIAQHMQVKMPAPAAEAPETAHANPAAE